MKPLYYLALILTILDFILLFTGLYKPWIVLWWMPRQNRKKVLRIYGTAAVLLVLLTILLAF